MRIVFSSLLLVLSLLLGSAQPSLRPLWTRAGEPEYLTEWRLCGPFFPDRPALTLERDYLQGQFHALTGRPELRSDGVTLPWRHFSTLDNPVVTVTNPLAPLPGPTAAYSLNISAILGVQMPDNAAMYAFNVLSWPAAGTGYFLFERSLGMGIDLWVNGERYYRNATPRSAAAQPLTAVPLREGFNAILLKITCSWEKPAFSLRVLHETEATLLANARPSRELLMAQELRDGRLTIYTGDALTPLQASQRGVAIRVAGAGGRTIAESQVRYGESASFDTGDWPAGGYDITGRLLAGTDDGETRDADLLPSYAHLLYYHGDAPAAARALVRSAPAQPEDDPLQMTHAALAAIIRDRMGVNLSSLGAIADVQAALMEWEEAQLTALHPPRPATEWFVRLAYRSAIDGSLQYARAYLPPGYDPNKRYPLIVYLHGMTRISPPYVKWHGVSLRYDGLADRYGAIVLHPHGRGNAWYRGLGEQDVLHAMDLALATFSIDDERVYLAGSSMGGAGVWHVGAAHPQRFAALAPFFGGREPLVTTPQAAWDAMTPRQKRFAERDSSYAQIESLSTTPVFVSHGDVDNAVPVGITRHGVRLLRSWGYPVHFWEVPGKAHGDLKTEDAVYPMLLAQRRVINPATVRVRAGSLTAARAHWLQVLQREDASAFVQAEARVLGGNLLSVDSVNALAIRVTPGAALLNAQAPLRVIWNGEPVTPALTDETGITLYARGYRPTGNEKLPNLEGPLGDVFNTPFLIVIGTSAENEAMRAYCRRYARRLVAWWQLFQQVTPRVAFDSEVTADEMARYSLILVGGPQENLLSAQLRASLPVTITERGFAIDGVPFAVRDGGVRLIYPNPRNAQRYLVLAAANSPAGMFRLPLFNNRYDVDFSITDGRGGRELAVGLFDRLWRIDERLLERGLPTGEAPPEPGAVTAVVPAPRLYVSDLLEFNAEGDFDYLPGVFPPLARVLQFDKERYPHSIAMPYLENPKSAVEYDLYQAGWKYFRAVLTLEKPAEVDTVVFIVKGDGKELFRSYPFRTGTPRLPIDIPIEGISMLRLEMEWLATPFGAVAGWGDARLER